MNIYFIILIILILMVIYFYNYIENFDIKEPFCSKKSSDECLTRFIYAYQVAGGKALGMKNYSILPSINTSNPNEKIMNFQCVPNNYPNETGGTDCNIWNNINDMNNSRGNDARDWFKKSDYYLDCKQIGKSKPGCAMGYNELGYKSYADLGYSCNVGNGLIPTKINPTTGVITCATDSKGKCLIRKSKTECINSLNLIPIDDKTNPSNINNGMVCTNGNIEPSCKAMYDTLDLKSLNELGYSCNTSIGDGNLPGKIINDSTYNFASYDNKTIISNCKTALNFQPLKELKDVVCSEYTSSIDSKYPSACEQAYTKFNIYPSTNPLVIKGNNLNYTISNTFKEPSSLSSIYSKYQQAFPTGTNSNSAKSISDNIENILSKTPIKLACCKRPNSNDNSEKNISVRVPVNPTIQSINPNTKKFNFQYSQINIPANSCPTNLYNGSPDCDNFFGINCDNIMNYMKEQNIDVNTELLNYAPECACYAPQTQAQQGYPPSTPSVCYKNGCDITSNPNVYLDPNSRDGDSQKTCSLTICNSINDFSGLTVGGGANISTQTQNQCGSSIPTDSKTQTSKIDSISSTGKTAATDSTGKTTVMDDKTTVMDDKTAATDDKIPTSDGKTPTIEGKTPTTEGETALVDSETASSDSNNYTLIIIVVVVIFLLLLCILSLYNYGKKK